MNRKMRCIILLIGVLSLLVGTASAKESSLTTLFEIRFGDEVYVSARSFGDINVQVITEKLGGGGHATVAGLQLKCMDMDEAVEKVKGAISEYLTEV